MSEIFVFGSNLHGIHKRGAALCALREHGAKLGQGIGLQGQSYAIPTKDSPYKSLELVSINKFVADFLNYAWWTPDLTYNVTPIGCGLAGYTPADIAPMFQYAKLLKNVNLPPEFLDLISN
jgi:hypothetical protein